MGFKIYFLSLTLSLCAFSVYGMQGIDKSNKGLDGTPSPTKESFSIQEIKFLVESDQKKTEQGKTTSFDMKDLYRKKPEDLLMILSTKELREHFFDQLMDKLSEEQANCVEVVKDYLCLQEIKKPREITNIYYLITSLLNFNFTDMPIKRIFNQISNIFFTKKRINDLNIPKYEYLHCNQEEYVLNIILDNFFEEIPKDDIQRFFTFAVEPDRSLDPDPYVNQNPFKFKASEYAVTILKKNPTIISPEDVKSFLNVAFKNTRNNDLLRKILEACPGSVSDESALEFWDALMAGTIHFPSASDQDILSVIKMKPHVIPDSHLIDIYQETENPNVCREILEHVRGQGKNRVGLNTAIGSSAVINRDFHAPDQTKHGEWASIREIHEFAERITKILYAQIKSDNDQLNNRLPYEEARKRVLEEFDAQEKEAEKNKNSYEVASWKGAREAFLKVERTDAFRPILTEVVCYLFNKKDGWKEDYKEVKTRFILWVSQCFEENAQAWWRETSSEDKIKEQIKKLAKGELASRSGGITPCLITSLRGMREEFDEKFKESEGLVIFRTKMHNFLFSTKQFFDTIFKKPATSLEEARKKWAQKVLEEAERIGLNLKLKYPIVNSPQTLEDFIRAISLSNETGELLAPYIEESIMMVEEQIKHSMSNLSIKESKEG